MTAVTAIKTDLRNEILRILRSDITYQVQDADVAGSTILATSIVFQKVRLQVSRSFEMANQMMDLPGLLVCQPLRTTVPPAEGVNERDWWHYHWLVQLIDNDLWDNDDRIGTWDKWMEQIMSAFMFSCLNGVVTLPKGQVICSTATGVQDVDERRWVRDGRFISGVEIEVRVQQPRGIIA